MPQSTWKDSGPYSRDAREWFADYLIRVTSVLAPMLGLFLLYRWNLGVLNFNYAVLALILLPFAVLPLFSSRLRLRAKALILLFLFSANAAALFAFAGLLGLGPLVSVLAALTALVFYGNRIFLILLAMVVVAVVASGLGHYWVGGAFHSEVDLSNPINIFGKTITLSLILSILLFGLRGATRLVSDQRDFAKKKSQELQRAHTELNQFIDSANAPIFGVDTEGRVNEWNSMTAKITGYSKEQALGKDLVETYIAEDRKRSVANVINSALEGKDTVNYELQIYSQSGQRVEILLNAMARRDSIGSIVGVIGVGQDITSFREQEKRLLQAQKMESVGHLTGGIAHDFNNLLAVIRGNLDLVINAPDSEKNSEFFQECMADAATAAADATKLTTQLLSFASQQSFRNETVNLRDLVSDSIQKISSVTKSGVEFSVDIDQCDLEVAIDGAQLEGAIVSLIENATYAIGESGKISVSLSIESLSDARDSGYSLPAGQYIVLRVTDDGCGIEENVLSKVTDPFYSTRSIGEGAGLGLSVIHGFAKKAGGQLRLQSEVGVGTRVDLVLPFVLPEQNSSEVQAEAGEFKFALQSGTVLVVEDEDRLRKLASRHLSSTGFEVIEAADAQEALALLAERNSEVDILVSDIRMPGDLSGRQLAEQVSNLYPGIRMLLTTGYEEEAEQSLSQSESPQPQVPVLRKPYSRAELIGAVSNLA